MTDFVAFSVDFCAISADFESLSIRNDVKSGRKAHIGEARSCRQVPLLPGCPSLARHSPATSSNHRPLSHSGLRLLHLSMLASTCHTPSHSIRPPGMPWRSVRRRADRARFTVTSWRGFAYPALLAAYSAKPMCDTMLDTRVNLYVVLIGSSGSGKSVSIDRANQSVELRKGFDYLKADVGGD